MRQLALHELELVSGGDAEPWGGDQVLVPIRDETGRVIAWVEPCSLSDGYDTNNCALYGDILVVGQHTVMAHHDGHEVRRYADGTYGLFVNGQFITQVDMVDASFTNGPPTYGASAGRDGVSFTFNDGQGHTYTFRPTPGQ
jgi:hypothetical protein